MNEYEILTQLWVAEDKWVWNTYRIVMVCQLKSWKGRDRRYSALQSMPL